MERQPPSNKSFKNYLKRGGDSTISGKPVERSEKREDLGPVSLISSLEALVSHY